jgi:hypothetical protein
MLKAILAGAIALTIGGASLVYAQQGQRARFTAEDAQAFVDARLAGVKAGLKLTPEQEKNWPAVETAVRDLAKERVSRIQERRAQREARRSDDTTREPRDGIAMLRQRADALTARAAGLKRLADAAEPLYRSLDDAQKRRLHILARGLRAHGEGFGRRGEGRGPRRSQPL